MRADIVLAALARRLNREAGSPPIPSLYFLTDPERTPDPARIAARLPRSTAIIYRHFGAPDRVKVAPRLARICRARGLVLLIAADPGLAFEVGAAGLHWPERLLRRRRGGSGLQTGAAHGRPALARATAAGLDAAILGPVFPTRSASGRQALGPLRAGRLARATRLPVIALGGVDAKTARGLLGRGFAGIAAVEGLA